MFEDLQEVHAAILSACDEIERFYAAPTMPRNFLDARWRFGKLSAQRSRVLHTWAIPTLAASHDAVARRHAERLKIEIAPLYDNAAKHIAEWNADSIAADWTTYCTQSRAILQATRKRLADEQRMFPTLQAIARKAG